MMSILCYEKFSLMKVMLLIVLIRGLMAKQISTKAITYKDIVLDDKYKKITG